MDAERRSYITDKFTFKDYFGPKKGANCVLAWNNTHKTWDWYPNNGCHGVTSSKLDTTNHTEVYSTLWCRHADLYDAACDYWDYLLSPTESPFRQALLGLERFNDKEGRPIAFGITNLSVPAQLAIPVMMQCRVPQEQSHKLRSWAWWRKSGFTKAESLWLSEHYRLHLDGTLSSLQNADYSQAFSAAYGIDMKALITGVPAKPLTGNLMNKTLENQHYNINKINYQPVNIIWTKGTSAFTALNKLLKGKNKYLGAFPKLYAKENPTMDVKGHGFCDKNNAVIALKAARSQWSVEVLTEKVDTYVT